MNSLLVLVGLLAYRYAAAVDITDIWKDISEAVCSNNLFQNILLYSSYCAQDGVPMEKCSEYSVVI